MVVVVVVGWGDQVGVSTQCGVLPGDAVVGGGTRRDATSLLRECATPRA